MGLGYWGQRSGQVRAIAQKNFEEGVINLPYFGDLLTLGMAIGCDGLGL